MVKFIKIGLSILTCTIFGVAAQAQEWNFGKKYGYCFGYAANNNETVLEFGYQKDPKDDYISLYIELINENFVDGYGNPLEDGSGIIINFIADDHAYSKEMIFKVKSSEMIAEYIVGKHAVTFIETLKLYNTVTFEQDEEFVEVFTGDFNFILSKIEDCSNTKKIRLRE